MELSQKMETIWPYTLVISLLLVGPISSCYKVSNLKQNSDENENTEQDASPQHASPRSTESDTRNTDPSSFCYQKQEGESEVMAELAWPSGYIAVDDDAVYVLAGLPYKGRYLDLPHDDTFGLWRIENADKDNRQRLATVSTVQPWLGPMLALDETHVYVAERTGSLFRVASSTYDEGPLILYRTCR